MMKSKKDDLVVVTRINNSQKYPNGKIGRVTDVNDEGEAIQVMCGGKTNKKLAVPFDVAPSSNRKGSLILEPLRPDIEALLIQIELVDQYFPPVSLSILD